MNRRNLPVRAARALQRLPLGALRAVEAPLVRMRADAEDPVHALVLLALPRSGSTLTYQALVHGLDVAYLSNLSNLLYHLPFLGGALSARLCGRHESTFRSDEGLVPGLCGPAEGLRYWSYWAASGIDERLPAAPHAHDARRARYLSRALSLLSAPDRPVVTGYLGHALVVERMRALFPRAVFVRLHRDPVANALSILRIRRARGGDWFSVFPRECADVVGSGLHREVAAQVYWLNRRLDATVDQSRTVHVHYDDLCHDPRAELDRVIDFCGARGFDLNRSHALPARFDAAGPRPEEADDAARLAGELEALAQRFGEPQARPS